MFIPEVPLLPDQWEYFIFSSLFAASQGSNRRPSRRLQLNVPSFPELHRLVLPSCCDQQQLLVNNNGDVALADCIFVDCLLWFWAQPLALMAVPPLPALSDHTNVVMSCLTTHTTNGTSDSGPVHAYVDHKLDGFTWRRVPQLPLETLLAATTPSRRNPSLKLTMPDQPRLWNQHRPNKALPMGNLLVPNPLPSLSPSWTIHWTYLRSPYPSLTVLLASKVRSTSSVSRFAFYP